MILGFKRNFPWGPETKFMQKIIASRPSGFKVATPKVHTIRAGNRWQPGRFIHFAYGQRTKDYHCFCHGTVKTVQEIIIYTDIQKVMVATKGVGDSYTFDFQKISEDQVKELATNDGFDSVEDFWKWFNVDLKGQIISWTGKLYL